MDLELGLGEWIIIGLSAILFMWYFAANAYNRRRGIATYRWLFRALENVGEIAHTEWIGSSSQGARLLVEKASRPFRKVESKYLLEPREFLPYWIFSRIRGKRDEVIILFTLRSVPKSLVKVYKKGSRRSEITNAAEKSRESKSEQSFNGFQIRYDGIGNQHFEEKVQSFLFDYADSTTTIELRREAPHLEIRAAMSPLLKTSAELYIGTLLVWFQDKDA